MSELSDSRKIPTNARALPLIKAKAIEQVDLSETEDSKRHASFAALRRIRFLASSQSLNFALPFSIARSASRNACACHAGDSNRSSSLERSAQSASIARNFSSRDIFFNGRTTGMNDGTLPSRFRQFPDLCNPRYLWLIFCCFEHSEHLPGASFVSRLVQVIFHHAEDTKTTKKTNPGTQEPRKGISEIEGKTAKVAAKERGQRLSFKAE